MAFPGSAVYPSSTLFPGAETPAVDHPVVSAVLAGRRVEATTVETVPRESVELLPLRVAVDGVPTNSYDTAMVLDPGRPGVWTPAVVEGARSGVVLAGLTPGLYRVWARVGAVVVEAGWVWVS